MRTGAIWLVSLLMLAGCGGGSDEPAVPKNRVILLGMIHSGHTTSKTYGLDVVRSVIEDIDPDYVLAEIPPDRLDEAIRTFKETGGVTELRTARFPEYVDVLFPLTGEMDFEIIPTAAWTRQMADVRRDALQAISQDPDREADWAAYQAGLDRMTEEMAGRGDDPFFVHTDEYDAITKRGLTPYATLFAGQLGTGDWETINTAHYQLIADALDTHAGEGATMLITFGAGHKYWFLEQLESRDDIELVSPLPYFETLAANSP